MAEREGSGPGPCPQLNHYGQGLPMVNLFKLRKLRSPRLHHQLRGFQGGRLTAAPHTQVQPVILAPHTHMSRYSRMPSCSSLYSKPTFLFLATTYFSVL